MIEFLTRLFIAASEAQWMTKMADHQIRVKKGGLQWLITR